MNAKTISKATDAVKAVDLRLKAKSTIHDLEGVIADERWGGPEPRSVDLRIPSAFEPDILADIWAGMLTGTLCRNHIVKTVGWGISDAITATSNIATSPAFLASLSSANTIASESGAEVDSASLRREFALLLHGLVDVTSGKVQTLVEFDPEYSVAPALRGGDGFAEVSALDRKRIFEQLVLEFRQKLEVAAIRYGVTPVNSGAAGDIGKFLEEIHENAHEHGSRDASGRTIRGTRLMRMRKHLADSKKQLSERCGTFSALAKHIEDSFAENTKLPVLIEACVSDFGSGIVDGFLATDAGRMLQRTNRRELLEALIYDRLSSKSSDPSAGLGLQKALDAARQMGAFVSLRTGEFWLTVSFAKAGGEPKLEDVSKEALGKVAGTHWQILWTQS
ncbi:hypothetical protein [Rhizobium leguminosarum]|jgi:hypothetical protein|uniref:hypothetical protein n=1 Tax=Rhizobium leguminosarum TaxID=384 RepID=UPI0010320F31|nr:hypothetical protein [Rhizobium leguminosarum]TAX34220.1 hypothetical protein ELI06_07725 [Rhizobium leguminosarum]